MADILTGLVAHWRLQDNAASTVIVAAVGDNATLVGGDNTSVLSDTGPGGSLPLSLHLNGSDDNISTGATSAGGVLLFADENHWSIGILAKVDTSHTGTMIAKCGPTAGNRTFQLFTSNTDATRVTTNIRGTGTSFNRTLEFVQSWRHYCAVWNGTTATLYIDGVSAGACNVGTATIEAENIKFGARTNTPAVFFDGSLADVRIYSRALAPDDVAALAVAHLGVAALLHQFRQRR